MADYRDEANLRDLAALTPEERTRQARFEASEPNLRELRAEIDRQGDPAKRAVLQNEYNRLTGGEYQPETAPQPPGRRRSLADADAPRYVPADDVAATPAAAPAKGDGLKRSKAYMDLIAGAQEPPPPPPAPSTMERVGQFAKRTLGDVADAATGWATKDRQNVPVGAVGAAGGMPPAQAELPLDEPQQPVANDYQASGPGGVLRDIRANEQARAQRLAPPPPSVLQRPDGSGVPVPERTGGFTPQEMAEGSIAPWKLEEQRRMGEYVAPRNPQEAKPFDIAQNIAQDVREFTDNPVVRGGVAGFSQLGQTGIGAFRLAADLVGADDASKFARGASRIADTVGQGATSDLKGNEKLVADVTSSIATSSAAVAVGALGGPGLTTLFVQSTLAEYNAGRDAGFGVPESLGRAGIMGTAEALGERFGFSEQLKLIKAVTKGLPQGELAKVMGAMIAKEIPGEQLTTAMQFLADKIGPAALRPNATIEDYLNAAGETLKVTVAQTAVMGGGPAAIVTGRNMAQQADAAVERSAMTMAERAASDAGFLRPVERRKQLDSTLDDLAAEYGVPPNAVKAIKEQAGRKPLDQLAGFYKRAVQALAKRGLTGKPVDEAGLGRLDQQPQADARPQRDADVALPRETGDIPVAAPADTGPVPADEVLGTPLDEAAHQAATSPLNDLPEPTDAQKQAGNYKVGRARIDGMDVSIENPKGSIRRSTADAPTPWEVTMPAHYGYIRRTQGADGDHVDLFIGDKADNGRYWIVNQNHPDGGFDEHKVITGVDSAEEALALYKGSFADNFGDKVFGSISAEFNADQLKARLPSLKNSRPVVRPRGAQTAPINAGAPSPQPAGGAAVASGPAAAAPAPSARVIARAGRAPNSAEPIELRANPDGTVTPFMSGSAMLNFDTAEPIVLPADVSDLDAKKAIREAGAVSDRMRFFPAGAAADQAAADLQAGLQELGGVMGKAADAPVPAPAPKADQRAARAKARMALDTTNDTVLQALAKMGGIRRDVVASEFGLKPEELKHTVKVGGLNGFPFRKTGGMDLDRALTNLREAGYFPGVSDEDARGALEQAIYDELGGGRTLSVQGQMADAQRQSEERALEEEAAARAEYDAEAKAEREAIMAEAGLTEADMAALDDDDLDIDAQSNTSTEAFLRAMGASEQEIQDALAEEAGRAQGGREEGGQAAAQEAGPADGAGSGQARPGAAEGEGLTLEAQTTEDLKAKTEREAAADELDQRQQIDAERDLFGLQQQAAPDQRRDNTGDLFGGPSAEDVQRAAAQQRRITAPSGPDLFSDAPAENPKNSPDDAEAVRNKSAASAPATRTFELTREQLLEDAQEEIDRDLRAARPAQTGDEAFARYTNKSRPRIFELDDGPLAHASNYLPKDEFVAMWEKAREELAKLGGPAPSSTPPAGDLIERAVNLGDPRTVAWEEKGKSAGSLRIEGNTDELATALRAAGVSFTRRNAGVTVPSKHDQARAAVIGKVWNWPGGALRIEQRLDDKAQAIITPPGAGSTIMGLKGSTLVDWLGEIQRELAGTDRSLEDVIGKRPPFKQGEQAWPIPGSKASQQMEAEKKAAEAKDAPAPATLPDAVQSSIRWALGRLNDAQTALSGVERARGRGHMLKLEWDDQQAKIQEGRDKLAEIRGLASNNGASDAVEAYIKEQGGEPDLERFNVTPAKPSPVTPARQNRGAAVTPQVPSAREIASFIGIAADSIDKLRASDVERVVREAPAHFRVALALHIKEKRADLAQEVDDLLAEIRAQRLAAPAPAPARAKTIAAEAGDSDAIRQAKADALKALGDLGDILSKPGRATMLPEQEQKLLPVLTRLFDAAFRLGYLQFKEAAKFVLDQIRNALGKDVADSITLDHLQGAYIGMAGKYKDQGASTKKDVVAVESLDEIEAAADNEDTDVPDPDPNLERDRGDAAASPRPVENPVRAQDGAAASGAVATGEPAFDAGGRLPSGEGLPAGGPAADGERGDQPVRGEGGKQSSIFDAGADVDPRGGGLGDGRIQPDAVAAEEADGAADRGAELIRKRAAQRGAQSVPVKPGDIDNIRESLPFLLPGQQEDVQKAERRFAEPDGYGMLFTNGTGTGKTFTGLGVVKRFERQGKKNILIVVPSDKIAEDWINSGKDLLLDITQLADTKTAGRGIVITTYANLGQNDELAKREWDLVVPDEAHYLMQEKDGTLTQALANLRAITFHPDGASTRAVMIHRDLHEAAVAASEASKQARTSDNQAAWDMIRTLEEAESKAWRAFEAKADEVKDAVAKRQGAARTRVTFLSATPFAYDKTIDWANGYLFDYGEGRTGQNLASGSGFNHGYNSGDWREQFFMQHLGYRMRYNKLTEPDAKVDRGLLRRQFNSWLKKRGVLSGRMLDVAADYDRRFVLVESAIGRRIDEALEWLRDHKQPGRRKLAEVIDKRFDYLSRRYLLEAIKAEEAVPLVKQHLAKGRKVVVFHDYKKGGGFHPFQLTLREDDESVEYATGEDGRLESQTVALAPIYEEFKAQFKDLMEFPFASMRSPIEVFQREFPGVLIFNGDVPSSQRRAAVAKFHDDATGPAVFLAQTDAAKVGISLHDTTGKHQRVLINLGQPTQPTTAIQQEGRVYRTGQVTDAILRYLNTGTAWEKWAFATTIATRSSAAEDLGMGEMARALKDSFIAAFEESDAYPAGHEGEGTGGKERDRLANAALSEYDRAKGFYWGTQKKSARTKAEEGVDYYATPEPVGLKMVEWLNLRPGEAALEPSAGHGAIARWFGETTKRTAIEPSGRLAARLALVFEGEIRQQAFEDLHVVNKFDGIAMNPPFGSGGRTAVDHLAKAATHLRDGGRIVALLPTGPAADKKFDKWFYEESERPTKPLAIVDLGMGEEGIYVGDTIKSTQDWQNGRVMGKSATGALRVKTNSPGETLVPESNVRAIARTGARTETYKPAEGLYLVADIKLPAVTFERAATSVMTRIVVLEKSENAPQQISRDYTDIDSIDELFDRLETLTLTPRAKPEEEEAPSPAETAAGQREQRRAEKAQKEEAREQGAELAQQAGVEVVEHTTGKGNLLKGVIRPDLTFAQAKEIDRFTFKKGNGWYIRLEHLAKLNEKYPPGGDIKLAIAYHGTPYRGIDRFDTSKIGTGEGAQAYGWGLYFASKKEVAEHYRKTLAGATFDYADDAARAEAQRLTNFDDWVWRWLGDTAEDAGYDPAKMVAAIERYTERYSGSRDTLRAIGAMLTDGRLIPRRAGQVYEVRVPDDDELLLWDEPLSKQPSRVRAAIESTFTEAEKRRQAAWRQPSWALKEGQDPNVPYADAISAGTIYTGIAADKQSWKEASLQLRQAGIKGIKYLDGGSRSQGQGSYNYVIFDGADASVQSTLLSAVDGQAGQGDTAAYEPASPADRAAVAQLQAGLRARYRDDLVLDAVPAPAPGADGQPLRGPDRHRAALVPIFKRLFDADVTFFASNIPFANGVMQPEQPGRIFVNIKSEKPWLAVTGHELLHKMRQDRPDLYSQLHDRIMALVSAKDLDFYRDLMKLRYDKAKYPMPGPDGIREELVADVVGDNMMDPKFWRALLQDQPSGFRRVVDAVLSWLDDLLQRITDMRPFNTGAYLSDIRAAREAVVDALRNYSAGEVGTVADQGEIRLSAMAPAMPTDSDAFKRWFGNSKVVDAEGKPLVVYHGTASDFKEYKSLDAATFGHWFTTDPDTASSYAGIRARLGGEPNVMPVYLSIKNPADERAYDRAWKAAVRASSTGKDRAALTRQELERQGYDGFDAGAGMFVAFRPEQIKSAIGNRGTFDPASSDIRLSVASGPSLKPSTGVIDTILRRAGGTLLARLTSPGYDKLLTLLDNAGRQLGGEPYLYAKAGLVADYGLTPDYLEARSDMQTGIRKGTREAATVIEQLQTLDRAQARVAYLWMQEKPDTELERTLMAALPEESREHLQALKRRVDELGREAVRLGLLSPETYERNAMAYLHRSYKKYELGDRAEPTARSRSIRILGEQFKGRGLRDDAAPGKIASPDWWQRRQDEQKADTSLKGQKFHRLELRKLPDDATPDMFPTGDPRRLGKLEKVLYWPENEPIPRHLADWRNDGLWEARFFDKAGKVGMWRDFTLAERTAMGEIQEVRYSAAKTLLQATRDVETAKLLDWIARNESVMSADMIPEGHSTAKATESLTRSYLDTEWVQVPLTEIVGTAGLRRYGNLAGRYIPGPVWNDIRQITALTEQGDIARAYQKLLTMWKISKALALDTPIPTPTGWTTMGALQPGDMVFDENGKPCEVLQATETQLNHQCFEVEFSDGSKIVADAGHLWFTLYRGKGGVRETRDILATLKEPTRGDNNHSIPVAGALELPDADLPIPPYVLGLWLGDGRRDQATMSVGGDDLAEIVGHVTNCGVDCTQHRKDARNNVAYFRLSTPGVNGKLDGRRKGDTVQAKLRAVGVFNNKHIPALYLRASEAQRRELLQGLMDSDGHITERGLCGFCTVDDVLKDGVVELIRSLGYKPTVAQYETRCNGKSARPAWKVHFKAYADHPVFKLSRKVERLCQPPETSQRSQTRQIVAVREVPSVPVRCILVSSQSHLFLAGDAMIPTHNTALSPATHTNNVMSNFILADAHDIQARHMLEAARAWLRHKDRGSLKADPAAAKLIEDYQDHGGDGGKFNEGELREDMAKELLDQLERDVNEQPEATAKLSAAQVFDLLRHREFRQAFAAIGQTKTAGYAAAPARQLIKLYGREDELFRLAAFIKARADGLSDHDAGRFARSSFLDYSINAPWINALRRTAFPFIAFTYRAVPMLLRVTAEKPWKMAKYALVAGSLNALAYGMVGDDGDEEKERALLPDEKSGRIWGIFPKLVRMPWNDDNDSPVFLDVRRWVPAGDVIDTNANHAAVPVPAPLLPGGPLVILGEIILNRQSFTGQNITKDTDTLSEKWGKLGGYLWKSIMPNFPGLPGTYSTDALLNAGGGKTDPFGREQSLPQAAASVLGVKVASYPSDVLTRNAGIEARTRIFEIRRDLRAAARQLSRNGISQAEYEEKVRAATEKIQAITEELNRKVGQSRGVPAPAEP